MARLRGMIARGRKDFAEAEKQFQALLQESPGDLAASNQLALALLDQEDEAKRRRGLELAEVNARQYPNAPDVLATLGVAYARLGRTEEAERVFQAAATRGQISSDTAYHFAKVLAARGRADDVLKLIDSALKAPGTFIHRDEAEALRKELAAKAGSPSSP